MIDNSPGPQYVVSRPKKGRLFFHYPSGAGPEGLGDVVSLGAARSGASDRIDASVDASDAEVHADGRALRRGQGIDPDFS